MLSMLDAAVAAPVLSAYQPNSRTKAMAMPRRRPTAAARARLRSKADLRHGFIEWDGEAGETHLAVGGGTCELQFGLLVAEGLDGLPGEVALLR